jgi:hypothetical protein
MHRFGVFKDACVYNGVSLGRRPSANDELTCWLTLLVQHRGGQVMSTAS